MARADEIRERIIALRKYEVLEENREGASAYAFPANHLHLGGKVFLKVYDVDPDGVDLYREARVLKELSDTSGCPNLVRVIDAERLSNDEVMMAMEYVDGGSLLTLIESAGAFPLMDAVRIARDVVRGVAELHARNLVHRDLKPANILLDKARTIAKIGDFGSIAELDENGVSVRTSKRSALYIPPEGWLSPAQHGRASDLYQVGVVLHELVNGPLPYASHDQLDAEALRQIRTLGGERLTDMDPVEATFIVNAAIERRSRKRTLLSLVPSQPYVPNALTRLIRKATAPKVDNRFQSSTDFLSALERIEAPNWRREGEGFSAEGWRGCSWTVTQEKEQFIVQRKKSADYRYWKRSHNLAVVFDAILEVDRG
jgi:serine/threonine protein kinase